MFIELLIVAFLVALSEYLPESLILTAYDKSLYARSTPLRSYIRPLAAATLISFCIELDKSSTYESPFII